MDLKRLIQYHFHVIKNIFTILNFSFNDRISAIMCPAEGVCMYNMVH